MMTILPQEILNGKLTLNVFGKLLFKKIYNIYTTTGTKEERCDNAKKTVEGAV